MSVLLRISPVTLPGDFSIRTTCGRTCGKCGGGVRGGGMHGGLYGGGLKDNGLKGTVL